MLLAQMLMQPNHVARHFIQPQMQLASGDPNYALAFNPMNNLSRNDAPTSINPHADPAPVTAPTVEATILQQLQGAISRLEAQMNAQSNIVDGLSTAASAASQISRKTPRDNKLVVSANRYACI